MATDDKDQRRAGSARRARRVSLKPQNAPRDADAPRRAPEGAAGLPRPSDDPSASPPSRQRQDAIAAALKASEDLLRDFVSDGAVDEAPRDEHRDKAHHATANRPQRQGRRGSRLFGTDKARWKRKAQGSSRDARSMTSSASAVPVRRAFIRKPSPHDASHPPQQTPEPLHHDLEDTSAGRHHDPAPNLDDAPQRAEQDSLLDELISFDTSLDDGQASFDSHHLMPQAALDGVNNISSIPLDRDPHPEGVASTLDDMEEGNLTNAHHDPYALEPNYDELSGQHLIKAHPLHHLPDPSWSTTDPSLDDFDSLPIPEGFGDDLGAPEDFDSLDPPPSSPQPLAEDNPVLGDLDALSLEIASQDDMGLADYDYDSHGDIDGDLLNDLGDDDPFALELVSQDPYDVLSPTPNDSQPSLTEVAEQHEFADFDATYADNLDFEADSISLNDDDLQNIKDGVAAPAASRSSAESIDYTAIHEVVWDVMEEVLGGRLIQFEEHIIQRLERRMRSMSVDNASAKSPPPSLSIPAFTSSRVHSTVRAGVLQGQLPSMAILPKDWGKRGKGTSLTREDERLSFFLELMQRRGADDLHLHVGAHPIVRVQGVVEALRLRTLRREDWTRLLRPICPPGKWDQWRSTGDVDFIHESNLGRYHVNMFRQRQGGGAVLRRIPDQAPRLQDLRMPIHLEKLADLRGGLCLFSGPYGSGTSNTVAALVSLINQRHAHRIITIEDPIDFVHTPEQSIIHQRVIGVHAATFAEALSDALREAPEVIVIGDMVDRATITMAIDAARAGILVYGTVRRRTARDTLNALIDAYPEEDQARFCSQLADVLRVVVCQQLLERLTGGRLPAVELLINTMDAGRKIRANDLAQLDGLIDDSHHLGMRRMDHSLADLVLRDEISEEAAMARAISPDELYTLIHGPQDDPLAEDEGLPGDEALFDDLEAHDEPLDDDALALETFSQHSQAHSQHDDSIYDEQD